MPVFQDFDRLTANLRTLQKASLIEMGRDYAQGMTGGIYMKIKQDPMYAENIAEVHSLLGVTGENSQLRFTGNFLAEETDIIRIRPRSLLGVMYYLSQAVEVPYEHELAGLVNTTCYRDGRQFDWNLVSGREMVVHVSECCPKCAHTAVCYRGYWFYIDDTDLQSKNTFQLLSHLFSLQAGQNTVTTPILTIPVG